MNQNDAEMSRPVLAPTEEDQAATPVFPLLHHIKRDVEETIDSSLTWEQLTASDVNFSIVRPLVQKYAALNNLAVVFACLVVRAHFIAGAEDNLAYANLKLSQASMCELLAIKLLRHFSHNPILLVAALTLNWNPVAGASPEAVRAVKYEMNAEDDDLDEPASAIEIAIATESKHFISSHMVQNVVNDIYTGRVIYNVHSTRSLVADNYKKRTIQFYDPRITPFLDHYRLRVPKYGSILEFMNFSILLLAFLLCLSNKDYTRINLYEFAFIILTSSFVLGEYAASQEHGWGIYMQNVWNGFDSAFIVIFLMYFGLRIKGLISGDEYYSDIAFDILACGACILFPRLAFFAISNNVIVLALRGMIVEFLFFMCMAAICFSGLLFTLWELANGTWTVGQIAWLMVQIWFGNTWLSFGQAASFHPVFGPPLMVLFAALSNTLLVTILISILSNTFARIDQQATQEYLFQYAITTIEGVKSDALFSYQPPFNLLAYLVLTPLSWFASPRTLHSVNVFLIKATSLPILVVIGIYERHFAPGRKFVEKGKDKIAEIYHTLPRQLRSVPLLETLMGNNGTNLMQAIFEVDLSPDEIGDLFPEEDLNAQSKRASRISVAGGVVNLEVPKSPDTVTRRRPSISSRRAPSRPPPPADSSSAAAIAPASPIDQEAPIQHEMHESPLARLFSRRSVASPKPLDVGNGHSNINWEETTTSIKRVETLLEGMRDTPVGKLRADIKELQDRQARIENLLMTLTRGMRGDTAGSRSTMSP